VNLATLLASVVGQLDRAGVPYMITGAVASSFHGRPRATLDVDIVIDTDAAGIDRMIAEIRGAGLYVDPEAARRALAERGQFNAIDSSTGWKVDFMVRRDRPFSREEFDRRIRADLLGTEAWIATAEDVVLAKLEWAEATRSERQLEDAAAILDVGDESIDLAYVERWVEELSLRPAWVRAQARRTHPPAASA
jgi:hypothetical protein